MENYWYIQVSYVKLQYLISMFVQIDWPDCFFFSIFLKIWKFVRIKVVGAVAGVSQIDSVSMLLRLCLFQTVLIC